MSNFVKYFGQICVNFSFFFFFSSWSNRNNPNFNVWRLSKGWSSSIKKRGKIEHFRCKVPPRVTFLYNKFHLSLLFICSSIFFSFEKKKKASIELEKILRSVLSFYFFFFFKLLRDQRGLRKIRILDVLLTFRFWEHGLKLWRRRRRRHTG